MLHGTSSADWLIGEAGNDQLYGGTGNNTLKGGTGADKLNGGLGKDTFVYSSNLDSIVGASDIINQFVVGSDKIDMSALNITVSNLVITSAGSLLFNVTHTASANFLLQVESTSGLTASDFVLA